MRPFILGGMVVLPPLHTHNNHAGSAPLVRRFGLVAGVTLNVALGTIVHLFQIPLYFDSIATVLVAIYLGLFPGILVAVLTSVILALTDQVLFPFVCCSILTVLITVGFVRGGFLRSLAGYLWLGIALAVANGLGGSIVSTYLFGGVTEVHGIDRLVVSAIAAGQSLNTAVFWAGMLTNLLDKLLVSLVAFLVHLRRGEADAVIPGAAMEDNRR